METTNFDSFSLEKVGRCSIEAAKAAHLFFYGEAPTQVQIDEFEAITKKNGQEAYQNRNNFHYAMISYSVLTTIQSAEVSGFNIGSVCVNDETLKKLNKPEDSRFVPFKEKLTTKGVFPPFFVITGNDSGQRHLEFIPDIKAYKRHVSAEWEEHSAVPQCLIEVRARTTAVPEY